jgi:hypothetical protein
LVTRISWSVLGVRIRLGNKVVYLKLLFNVLSLCLLKTLFFSKLDKIHNYHFSFYLGYLESLFLVVWIVYIVDHFLNYIGTNACFIKLWTGYISVWLFDNRASSGRFQVNIFHLNGGLSRCSSHILEITQILLRIHEWRTSILEWCVLVNASVGIWLN